MAMVPAAQVRLEIEEDVGSKRMTEPSESTPTASAQCSSAVRELALRWTAMTEDSER